MRVALVLVLLAACAPSARTVRAAGPPPMVDAAERTFQVRASRTRPYEPLGSPVTPSSVAARPAPQRRNPGPRRAVQALPAAVSSSGCTGRMTRDRAHQCWDGLLAAYPWPQAVAFRVLYCESTGDPNASNGGHNGLFQVERGPFDPAANVALAFTYWQRRGWQPWTCA